jgi:hypothetical protein
MGLIRNFPRPVGWLGLSVAIAFAVLMVTSGVLGKAHAAGVPLLPNLVADPVDGVFLETSKTEGGLKGEGEEKLLLRFNGYIHNQGPGAVDFRGSRSSPKEPMKAFQRVYNSEGGFKEEPSAAELVYAKADGHEHWHLQRAAKYSLWNSSKTAEVTPAMKVGFCLDDSQHVDPFGPGEAVYSDAHGREFCRQHQPEALNLFEGISIGWRDKYESGLAFQWVDASYVLPGEYWLREDMNPTGAIKEVPGAKAPGYAVNPVIIQGFDANPQSLAMPFEESVHITLSSTAFKDKETPKYAIVPPQPQHGTLTGNGSQVTYTPAKGYFGPDSFTYSAADPHNVFPRSPAIATVSLTVAGPPSVAVSGAPAQMIVGTGVTLSAAVENDTSGVIWSGEGTFTNEGPEGKTVVYVAPSSPGTVTVTAALKDNPKVSTHVVITVLPAPVLVPAPQIPAGETAGFQVTSPPPVVVAPPANPIPSISRPRAMLVGRKLVMSTIATVAGQVRLSAYLGKRLLGTCASVTPADRSFSCRLTLGKSISLRSRIRIVASLRDGSGLLSSQLGPQRIPFMRMVPLGANAHAAFAHGVFWCSPSQLGLTFEGGAE